MKVFEKLQKKFQHIFMLNLSTRGDRRHKMIQQLFDFIELADKEHFKALK